MGKQKGKTMVIGLLKSLFSRDEGRDVLRPLYNAAIARARDPDWYMAGAVPDTLDGRFDMLAAIVSLIIIRIEDEGEAGKAPSVMLTELFIDDMDGQLRQEGVGDVAVAKHLGHMVSALGGRLGAYRAGLAEASLDEALRRNLYRGDAPAAAALAHVSERLNQFHCALKTMTLAQLIEGELP